VDSLSLAFSSGWASGINSYLVVLVLGIADRVGHFAQIPGVLGRWAVGAVIGVLLARDATPLDQAVSDAVGGGTALASHLVKMGGRLAINSSPAPVSNIVASLSEDAAVLGLVW
jgi:hypothetical protein